MQRIDFQNIYIVLQTTKCKHKQNNENGSFKELYYLL